MGDVPPNGGGSVLAFPNHSPHKFRHGNAMYSIKMARDISALKAVSQNLMHSNLSITDGVYGVLSGTGVRNEISNLERTRLPGEKATLDELLKLMREVSARLGDA